MAYYDRSNFDIVGSDDGQFTVQNYNYRSNFDLCGSGLWMIYFAAL